MVATLNQYSPEQIALMTKYDDEIKKHGSYEAMVIHNLKHNPDFLMLTDADTDYEERSTFLEKYGKEKYREVYGGTSKAVYEQYGIEKPVFH
jgi:hypothetical protein